MARSRETKIELTAYDDLFQTDESREEAKLSKIRDIPISEIDEFPDHPFKVLMDEDMEQLVESIHGYLFAAFGHPSGSRGGIAPFSAVGIHVADLCRYFGKDPLRSDTDYLPYPRSLHLWVGSDTFRLLGGNILKGAMRIAAYLPKLVGFIAGVQRQGNGEHGRK